MFCPKCGKQLADNAHFCDACGEKMPVPAPVEEVVPQTVPETPAEPAAPEEQAPEVTVEVEKDPAPENQVVEAVTNAVGVAVDKVGATAQTLLEKLKQKGVPAKWVKLGSAVLAGVLVIVILLSLFLGGSSVPNYALYLKDDEMYYSKISGWKPMQVTEDLLDGEDVDNSSLASAANTLGRFAVISEDGKTLFYADKAGDGINLYYRSVANAKKAPTKIDDDVLQYRISKNAKLVIYLTDDGDLYQYDMKNKDKIDSDVVSFYTSEDCKTVVYSVRDDDETNVYLKKGNKESEKLASDIGSLYRVDIEKSVLYYYKDEDFYQQKFGKDKEKVVSDVHRIVTMYENGSMYYLKTAESSAVLFDYVDDDMAEVDAKMQEPIRPTYPNYSDYGFDRYAEYQEAVQKYNEANTAYWNAYELYRDKLDRDNLREQLKDTEIERQTYALYYFDGKNETLLTESSDEYSQSYASDTAVILYNNREAGKIDKVKISEISYVWDVQNKVNAAMETSATKCLAVKDKVSALDDYEDASHFHLDDEGKTLYFVDNLSDDGDEGDLYKAAISGGKLKKAEVIEEEIAPSNITYLADGKYLVFRDVKNSEGSLYLGDKKVSDDVYVNNMRYSEDGKTIYFITDWDADDADGTLNVSKNGKAKVISDDVYHFVMTPNGEALYLYDYNTEKCRGDLYLCKGSKGKKVDEDVVAIVPVYAYQTMGYGIF